jgi:DNA-binding transcriptional ArsR family regulator
VLRALADESRRTVLEALADGPATAGELAGLLPIARPEVSRHLRVLREAGLVEVRQEAQRRVYSLRPGRVEACEPPRHLRLAHGLGEPDMKVIEATLTADGDQALLVVEERGIPPNLLAAYGAGVQVHVEDLAAHIAGRERCDAGTRWDELPPAHDDLAANVS